jgi:dTMP kinase
VLRTREPGGTPAGEQIRQVLLDHRNTNLTAHAEALLVLAARVQHLHEVIRPALSQGAIVLCDRFVDSTLAYQGYGRGLNVASLRRLNRSATQGLDSDLTILFDVPVATGLARRRSRSHNNRLDVESNAFHIKIRKGFLQLARREPDRIKVVDASVSPNHVSDAVRQLIAPLLRRRPLLRNLLTSRSKTRKTSMTQVG